MAGEYVLAIDQGTTGTTVLIFDHAGALAGRAYSEFTQYYPRPGWVEHDANEIWNVSMRVVGEALGDAQISARQLAAIGITNQRETAVMWDRSTGEPVNNAIVWQDRRGAALCGQLSEAGNDGMVRDKTGLTIDAYFSGSKVAWMLDNVEGLRERAERGEIAFGTIDSWMVYKLTGGNAHVTDYSNASRTLLYNIYDLQWDQDLLTMFNVPSEILPEVRPSSYVYSTLR